MLGTYFYHQNIKKMVTVFGTMFNNIVIKRADNAGNIIKSLKVPIAYGPKQKFIVRLRQDAGNVRLTAPRISFEYTSIAPDGTRKLQTMGKVYAANEADKTLIKFGYQPVPFNFDFNLTIYTKFAEDSTQILEQILPFFTPEFHVTAKENSDLGIVRDIPIIFTGMTTEDTYEGDFLTRRALINTLTFTMKGYIWGPTKSAGLIKKVTVDSKDFDTGKTLESYSVTPDPITAGIDDEFGFIETVITETDTLGIQTFFILDENGIDMILAENGDNLIYE